MKAKLQTEDAKAKYKRRKSTAESVFGIIENVLGFTHFHPRGLANVKTEWLLVTLAYDSTTANGQAISRPPNQDAETKSDGQ